MDIDARSKKLFGRLEALRIWAAIGRLAKPEFSTGEIVKMTGIDQCSKELGKLDQVGLVRSISHRGDYARVESAFWSMVDQLSSEWEDDSS